MVSAGAGGVGECPPEDIMKDISDLEMRLKSLGLSSQTGQDGAYSSVQNQIRTALKNIGGYCAQQKLQNGTLNNTVEISRLHEILQEPLGWFEIQSGATDADASNILSFLKLLAEMCPMSPQNKEKEVPLQDDFWVDIIEPICSQILVFLNYQVFQKCHSLLASNAAPSSSAQVNSNSPLVELSQGTGFAFHQQLGILLKGVRILLVYLKRATANLSALPGKERKLDGSISEVLKSLCALMNPTENYGSSSSEFDVGLDIRCNIGVAICYSFYYLRLPKKSQISSFFKQIYNNNQPSQNNYAESDIEKEILSLTACEMNRVAMAFGILNTWLEQEHDEHLYLAIGKNVLDIEHGVKEAVNLGSARILEALTEKLSRPCVPSSVLKHVSSLFGPLEFFCFMYMPGHIDAVKNCCRNALSALSRVYDRLDGEQFFPTGEDNKGETWISSILKTILEKPAHIKWIALACVSKNTKKSLKVLELDPTLPKGLLSTQRTFNTTVNDTYIALMSYHFEICSEIVWEKTWIEPLFTTQLCQNNESNWPQKRSIVSTILSSEKVHLAHVQVMVLPLLKSVVRRMNSGPEVVRMNNSEDGFTEASLLAAETIKLAYELKITLDPKILNLGNVAVTSSSQQPAEDSFRGLVPRSVLHSWLWSDNQEIRLAGFALLVETKKTSEPISKQDFESLKIFFKYNLASQNPAFRQQFLAYFKKLMKILRDGESCSRRKRDAVAVKLYKDFLLWLWTFLAEDEGLFSGSNFGRRCQALECLSELTLNFKSFDTFGINKDTDNTKYLRWLADTYENNKSKALEVLVRMPIQEFEDEKFCDNLFKESITLCKSVKPPDSVTGRYLMTLLLRKCTFPNAGCKSYTAWRILESLYLELHQIHEQIKTTSLTQVASENPLYGCVNCIQMILQNTDDFKQSENAIKYREYVKKLEELCFEINDKLFPVLGSAAPEGFLLPVTSDSAQQKESKQVVRSMAAQVLLVCAWRTMKEICLLMADMCNLFVMEGETMLPPVKGKSPPTPMEFLLSFRQVSLIGDHLLYLLKNLMHRGVFEQVFVGFKLIANRLWKSTSRKLNSLPEKWLKEAMDQEHISAKSITRRSGGLPFIFQALLSAESDNEAFLHKWLERLLIFDESPEMSPIRIHSMNVLRGLFRDASFSAAMMPFVPHGLKMAFRGLKSSDWTERNSGLMLYGAVMRRSFGAKLNLMNAPTFFRKFPQMYDFLLEELDVCIQRMYEKIEKNKQPKLHTSIPLTCDFTFHLLLLLSSFTASGRVEDAHFKLAEFIPRIRKCGVSDDSEVRKLAAKALVPFLVSPEDKLDLATAILDEIKAGLKMPRNQRHGLLLQFLSVIKPQKDSQISKTANLKMYNDFFAFISMDSVLPSIKAPTVYETIMDILISFYEMKSIEDRIIFKGVELVEKFYQKQFGEISMRNCMPGLPVADKCIAHAVIKVGADALETETFLERIYNYFRKPEPHTAYIKEFMELCVDNKKTVLLLCTDNVLVGAHALVECVIDSYLDRVIAVFSKFLGTPLEVGYLKFMQDIPVDMYEVSYRESDELVKRLNQRLFQVCDENYSTSLHVKTTALMVLGKLAFSTSVPISETNQVKLCDMVLQWSGSGMDDDMRYAVAENLPEIPFNNVSKFSRLSQAKIWGSIFMLAQDDEGELRYIITRKIHGTDSPCCGRKTLEILTKIFFHEFLALNPVEGMIILIGLLLRDNFEIEARAADDENEDRLFDKSEMNMYFEYLTFTRTVTSELKTGSSAKVVAALKLFVDSILTECQANFYFAISSTTKESGNIPISQLSIRKLVEIEAASLNFGSDCNIAGETLLNRNSSNDIVKVCISKFLQEFLTIVDQS